MYIMIYLNIVIIVDMTRHNAQLLISANFAFDASSGLLSG